MKQSAGDLCRGRWVSILSELGVSPKFLSPKHGPCPMCGGKDRFRFDDKDGKGTWICNHCGSGDGFTLLMKMNGWDFNQAKEAILPIAPTARMGKPQWKRDDDYLRKTIANMWAAGVPVTVGDPVDIYLQRRKLAIRSPALRYLAKCRYHETGEEPRWLPAMLASVIGPTGDMINIHRTYLTLEGSKADVRTVRKMMPGPVPHASAIRLTKAFARLGVAEGVETALAASQLYGMPVWSVVNSSMMLSFQPPVEVGELHIFADNDKVYGGQSAAYALAHRVSVSPLAPRSVAVHVPPHPGTDWNDVLRQGEE